MKLITRILIIAVAFFVSASVMDAQSSKRKMKSSYQKSKTKAKQKSKSKLKSGIEKVKGSQDDKGSYQSGVISPIVKEAKYKKGESFESDSEFKICLDDQLSKANWYQRKFGFGKSYNKWQKGETLTSFDKNKILGEASKCEKSGSKIPDIPEPNENTKGYKNTGKTKKGAKTGNVG